MKRIVLLCAAGMSTSLLMNKMRDAAKAEGFECTIEAYPTTNASSVGKDADVILLGPQVRLELNKVKNQVSCPVDAIDMVAYGTMNGKKVLEQAKKLLGV